MKIECRQVSKVYYDGKADTVALANTDLIIAENSAVAIVGESGAGKSTLLNILAGVTKPTTGQVLWNDEDIFGFSDKAMAEFRRNCLGLIMQESSLITNYTVMQNILLPLTFVKSTMAEKKDKINLLLGKLGILELSKKQIKKLSVGEKQRVAIARAIINEPKIIMADELTSSLDEKRSEEIIDFLLKIKDEGRSLIVVTHDLSLAARFDRIITLKRGQIIADTTKS